MSRNLGALTSAMHGLSAKGMDVLANQCIPTNTLLSAPLAKPLLDIEGAMGGLLFSLVGVMAVAFTLIALMMIRSKHASHAMRTVALVFVVPLALIVLFIIYTAVLAILNNAC